MSISKYVYYRQLTFIFGSFPYSQDVVNELQLHPSFRFDSFQLTKALSRTVPGYCLLPPRLHSHFIPQKDKNMDITGLIIALLIGAIAGFLAGQFITGRAFGLLGNIVVGIIGALVFGWLFGNFNLLNSPLLNEIAGGTIGAVILLFAIGLVKKAT